MNFPTMNKRILIAGVFVMSIPCLILFLFAFDVHIPDETNNAYQKWQALNIRSYEIHYRFGSFSAVKDVYITVEDGQIVKLEDAIGNNPRSPIAPIPSWYTIGFNQVLPPDLSYYTVDGLLDYWKEREQQLDQPPLVQWCNAEPRYTVHFDAERGYINQIAYTDCNRHDIGIGFLCPEIPDCYTGATVIEFEPMTDSR